MEEKIFINNKKDLKLACILYTPENKDKAPFVILLRGFTGYKEEEHIVALSKLLDENGIGSIRFDASGYGESEGTLEDDYRFTNSVSDTESVYDYVKSLVWVDKEKVAVWGNSMGGIEAVLFAKDHPEVKAAIIVSAPDKMGTSDILGKQEILKAWKETGYTEKISSKFGKIRIPYAFIEDAQKYDASELVKDVHSPLLAIWGTADVNVTPSQSKKIFDNANKPKESMIVDGMDHRYKKSPEILTLVNQRVIEFLQKNL